MPAVTPYLAAFYALALNLGYGFFCGSLLFLINLSGSRVLGFAVLSAQHIISYLIRFKYLPFLSPYFQITVSRKMPVCRRSAFRARISACSRRLLSRAFFAPFGMSISK